MICVKCGREVPDLPFCGACGWKQEKAPPVKHKRGNGQGSVYKLPSGKYKAVVTTGYYLDEQGRTRRHTRSQVFATKRDAVAALPGLKESPKVRQRKAMTFWQVFDAWLPTLFSELFETELKRKVMVILSELECDVGGFDFAAVVNTYYKAVYGESDSDDECEECGGKRFKPAVLEVKYQGKSINEVLDLSVEEAIAFFGAQKESAAKKIAAKLQILDDVGLGYVQLGQSSSSLSGGESQRVKLAQFLSKDSGGKGAVTGPTLFIFDEPTTGLHFYDVEKLLKSFDALLAKGHSIVVVEHNMDVIRSADWIIDLGPEAGHQGGNLVFAGKPEDLKKCKGSHTAKYL